MVDDQNPQDPQVPVSTTDQTASSDTNRPDSTIMADSTLPPADSTQSVTIDDRPISPVPSVVEETNSADPTSQSADSASEHTLANTSNLADILPAIPSSTSPPSEEPVSTISADPSQVLADSPPTFVSPTESLVRETPPAPVPKEAPSSNQTPAPPSLAVSSSDLSNPSDLNNSPPIINVSPPEIKPIEVQPDSPNSIPTVSPSSPTTESASIKPEPPQSAQNTPMADFDPAKSTPTTFGDLLSDNTSPVSPPPPAAPTTNDQPPTNNFSFGDLIKDIKPEESVIQPPPVPPTSPPISLPVTNYQPLTTNISSPNLSVNRFKANQARIQKKAAHLQKILDLAKTKGKINNQDIRNVLRSSQSTVTQYLKELVSGGKLKKEGKAKATYYSLTYAT